MNDTLLFVLLTFASFRAWRLLAIDGLPPLIWIRDHVQQATHRRFGPTWAAGVTCPWCSGWWVSCAVVGAVWAVRPLPLPALWFGAVSVGVGLVAQWDDG